MAAADFRSDSDYDLLCLRNGGPRTREIIKFKEAAIDLIIEDVQVLRAELPQIYLWQSKVLLDEEGAA